MQVPKKMECKVFVEMLLKMNIAPPFSYKAVLTQNIPKIVDATLVDVKLFDSRSIRKKVSLSAFILTEEEMVTTIESYKCHAILKFTQTAPHIDLIRDAINQRRGLKITATVGLLNAKQVPVQTYYESDFNKVLTRDSFRMLGSV